MENIKVEYLAIRPSTYFVHRPIFVENSKTFEEARIFRSLGISRSLTNHLVNGICEKQSRKSTITSCTLYSLSFVVHFVTNE